MVKTRLYIIRLFTLLLLFSAAVNQAWAAKVTYHVLTLPLNHTKNHNQDTYDGKRLEALKITVTNATKVELPAQYRSPLVGTFTYYTSTSFSPSVNAEKIYEYNNTKYYVYTESGTTSTLTPGADISSDCEIYVTYTYNASNGIADLSGETVYNIYYHGGFLAYNRGRNNRPAVVPERYITAGMLANEDFVKVDLSDGKSGITTYWNDATNNKNKKAEVESQFNFLFTYEGEDPYNIIIRSKYNNATACFIEKNSDDSKFVNKYYKGAALYAHQNDNIFLSSDEHVKYTHQNTDVSDKTVTSDDKPGYFHSLSVPIWESVTLLNNKNGDGYIFLGTKTVNDKGAIGDPSSYLGAENKGTNNLRFQTMTFDNATKDYSTAKEMYKLKNVNFIVTTPFGNTVSATKGISEYFIKEKQLLIDVADIPDGLKRKYCNFNSKFYSDAAHTHAITKYSEATADEGVTYNVYVGYEVSSSILFKSATETDTIWYELTDAGSTQEYGRKIKYDTSTSTFKNNGANGEYVKASEFAFIGDPYELRVISRSNTWATPSGVSYVGVESPFDSGKALTASTSATEGYNWDIPNDAVEGSFLLRKFNAEGYWNWTAVQPSQEVRYGTDTSLPYSAGKDAQTITFNVTGLAGNKYIKVTTDGTDASQIVSVTPNVGFVVAETGATATVTVKLAANASGVNKTMTVTIQEYDDNEGNTTFGSASVITITQGTSSSSFTASTVAYNTTNSTYVKVLELPKRKFTYNIVDKAGNIAAKATASQTIYSQLKDYTNLPSVIISPYILDESLTFYSTFDNGSGAGTGTSRTHLRDPMIELTEGDSDPEVSTNIYVKYTTSHLDNKTINLSEDQEFNVKLNGLYIYYDKTNHVLKTDANPSDLQSSSYLWKLRNRDPYNMLLDNMGAREDLSVTGTEHVTIYNDEGVSVKDDGTPVVNPDDRPLRQKGAWVKLATILGNEVELVFDTDRDNAQRFIAKSSTATGIYEVMVATNTADAGTTYYNIGCPGANTVKIYNNLTYAHGSEELKFVLNQNIDFTYHLIDKAHHELLTANSKNPNLALPAEYQSPLVASYSYYARDQITVDESKTPYEYTPTDPSQKITEISDLYATYNDPEPIDASEYDAATENKLTATDEADMINKVRVQTSTGYYYFNINSGTSYKKIEVTRGYRGNQIYVTYEKNDLVTFNDDDRPYLLRFLHGSSYKMEDGNDRLTETALQAIYPYTNGDGSLNIYGQKMNEEQMGGGASTRPRWVWFFESDNNDPYHVRIHSKSTISYNSISHPTYLQTYAVHFEQDADADTKHIVTGGVLAGIASVEPTEYMILGSAGKYKLLTTQTISDGVSNERRTVNSLEQYWKTYNMIKLDVLGLDKSTDAFSNDESTWVVPKTDDPSTTADESTYRATLTDKDWHSYDAVANAVRWNGYNDKADGHEKKVVEKLEHWFQTFDMGEEFAIESAVIPPVLVLLDRHGWEIMRKPLPTSTYPYGDELKALRAYDSPMVKEYKFYSQATKASGCHKYTLRMQNGAERDTITYNGKHYTSNSLAKLPPLTSTGVKSGNAFNDQFVTYTVKEEYENSYNYHLELHEEDSTFTESGTASKFLILQNGRYFKDKNEGSKDNYITKPIHEGSSVPNQEGTVFDMILDPIPPHASSGDHKIKNTNMWYVGPNLKIDEEMGIKWAEVPGGSGEPLTEYETKKAYKDKTGFDPYNLQFQNVGNSQYVTTHMTTTSLSGGAMVGDYSGGSTGVTLAAKFTSYDPTDDKGSEGYDHTYIQMSNQTFMAVSDGRGNMQLMPRFDHNKRVDTDGANPWNTTLEDSVMHTPASVDNNSSMGRQTTFLVRPQVFEYHIIDNKGNEALSYKRSGDYAPDITEHFKSPLATDFKYYYDHAASTTSASTKASYNLATLGGSTAFQKIATSDDNMTSQAKQLTVLDDYYFRVGAGTEESPYTYKKVTVTEGYVASPATDATYSSTDCTEDDWTYAVAYQKTAASEAAMQTAILSLGTKGLYYYQLGSEYYAYKKVVRSEGANTITISDAGHYEGSLTATDEADFEAKAKALSSDGTYYYKIGPLYNYQKVVVSQEISDFKSDVAAKKDISDKEITGSFADAGLNGDNENVYVRYSYWSGADIDQNKILQGKWFTLSLNNKEVLARGTLVFHKTVANSTDYDTEKAALSSDGEYYFRIGTSSYTYKKVTVSGSGGSKLDVDSDETEWTNTLGTGVSLLQGTGKPTPTVDGSDSNVKWQWKLLAAPMDPESEYYVSPDPYAIELFNREKNYTTDLSLDPNPMSVPIKINGADHFVLLSHPNGGYALAAQGSGYTYTFLNGSGMDTDDAATTVAESTNESDTYHFTIKSNALSPGAELYLNDDVTHTYSYRVINNDDSGNKIAATGMQNNETAKNHNYAPTLPDDIQSPLLNMTDYSYYGNVSTASAPYKVVEDTKLYTLYGLYKDEVYVRYGAYDVNQTKYLVPNKRNATSESIVARDSQSKDAALNINGRLPYNIIWYDDNMMKAVDSDTDDEYDDIGCEADQELSGNDAYTWQFEGNDPYALKIKHKTSGKYVNNSSGTTCTLGNTATPFMLLKKDDYDYGVLQVTEGTKMLSGYGNILEASDETHPKKFIIFGLSVNDLIYHLVICPTNTFTPIPYRETEPGTEHAKTDTWVATDTIWVQGSTQRDLTSGTPAGATYQLGNTMNINDGSSTTAYPYNYDAGAVSIGDVLGVPTEFYRPNCTFEFYIDGIYDNFDTGTKTLSNPNATLNNLYKGVKLNEAAPRLMSDEGLINKTIRVNVVYSFDKTVATNTGMDFVRSVDQNLWYTYETYNGSTPYLAHYTNAWGLQSMEGRATRYTNDYLWTPLGDPYGFKMYNRYMIKNSGSSNKIMTTSNASFSEGVVEGTKLKMEEPVEGSAEERNAVYELLTGDADGYFRIHPVINTKDQTQYYVRRYDDTSNPDYDNDGSSDLDYTILSTEPCDWRFGLDMTLLEPYYNQAGYIGGLTTTPKEGQSKSGKELYEDALSENIIKVQKVVYDDNNIVDFSPGYYRLHSMPGTPGISPVRYASGYLHDIERDQDGNGNESDAIPMHFYSRVGTTTTFKGLGSGFTVTNATRGEIPVPATEYDPSTIFYLDGGVDSNDNDDKVNPRVFIRTQGLYVKGNVPKIVVDAKEVDDPDHGDAVMTATSGSATKFSLIGIGGAVFLITDKLDPPTRNYLHYGQSGNIYDLKYFHNSPTNEARWCIEPANNQGLKITTNNGGDDYYYTTFCAPYDVQLPDNDGSKTYYAYTSSDWQEAGLYATKVPKVGETESDVAGKYVPAGTPVVIRVKDDSGNIKVTLPSTSPSSPLGDNIFEGKYLEQLLNNGGGNEVYTLGLPFTSDVEKADDYAETGNVEAPIYEQARTGVGFYINANPNKEHNALQSLWLRNNRYVIHNKIYYRVGSSGHADARANFVPLLFDDPLIDDKFFDPEEPPVINDPTVPTPVLVGDVYDLMGRRVATAQQVLDGTWKLYLPSGVYIIGGKKVMMKRGN